MRRTSLLLLILLSLLQRESAAQNPAGVLAGQQIVISPGHGYYWHSSLGWITQRPLIDELIEDIHTHEIVHDHLLPWLEGTGVRTVLCRARSRTVEEHIIQDDDGFPAYQETGAWSTSLSTGWAGSTYRFTGTSPVGGATATFRTTITRTDHYPVYVAFRAGANRTTQARVEVSHAGGTSWRTVDQTRFNLRWLHVGTFPFRAMEEATVTLSSASPSAGVIIADAVKIGDGMGSIARGGAVSGQPRWKECSRYHAEYFGAPPWVWDPIVGGQDNSDDVTCRPFYGEWYCDGQADLYLSLHTNAGGGSGTSSFIHNSLLPAGSVPWQDVLHGRLLGDLTAHWSPTWIDRGQFTANFGELRELSTMPGCLVELAFHDDVGGDVEAIHHPEFRAISGRAMARAVLEYLAPGAPMLAAPPTSVAMRNSGGGQLTLTWNAVPGASSYRVRTAADGFGYDDGQLVTGTSFTINGLTHDAVRYAKVACVNASGTGPDSEPVGARVAPGGAAPLLVVNGFDRRDRSLKEHQNPRHWLVVEGGIIQAVTAAGYPFDGCTNEAVQTLFAPLTDYTCVGWILGEESTQDETFNAIEQFRVTSYLTGGGRVFYTGAEVGWDLDWLGTAADRAFYEQTLGQDYVADDAGTYWTQAQSAGVLGSLPPMMFDDGSVLSDIGYPDVVQPTPGTGGQVVLRYATGAGAAVLHGNGQVLGIGFPLEALEDPAHRAQLMERVLAAMCPLPLHPQGTPQPGQSLAVAVEFPSSPGQVYIAAAAAGVQWGQPLPDGRTIPLNPDPLFSLSLSPTQPFFSGMTGTLNSQGVGAFQVHVPNLPSLSGFSAWFSAVTLHSNNTVDEIAPWVRLRVP